MNGQKMIRGLGLTECITITSGAVIGVGLFTVSTMALGWWGNMVIIPLILALTLSLYPAMIYAELGAMLPYAGGGYNYVYEGLGPLAGMLYGWSFVISSISISCGEALVFANYIKFGLSELGFDLFLDSRIIGVFLMVLFIAINFRGVRLSGLFQNGIMYFFWIASFLWFVMMAGEIDLSNLAPMGVVGDPTIGEYIKATSYVWWAFAGFETAVAMGEEIRYPQITIPRAMVLSPFIVFSITAAFQWFLLGAMPRGELILLRFAESPYAEGMLLAGIVGIPVALLSIAISFGSLSSINPCIASPARGLFSMSRDGIFPHWFDVLHGRFRTPFIAILLIGGVSIMLISSGSIVYIASISLFAELFFYVLAFASSISLRKKYPDLERPYRCPHLMVGAPILILAYFILMSQLERDAMITGLVWLAIGIIIYEIWIHTKTGKKSVEDAKESFNRIEQRLPLLPDQETKRKLDRTYKLWKIGIAIIFLFVVFLFILPRLLNL